MNSERLGEHPLWVFFSVCFTFLGLVTVLSLWVITNFWDYDAADRLLGLQVFLGLTVLLVLFFYHYIKKQPEGVSAVISWCYKGLVLLGAIISCAIVFLAMQSHQLAIMHWQFFAFCALVAVPWLVFSTNSYLVALVAASVALSLSMVLFELLRFGSDALGLYILAAANFAAFYYVERYRAAVSSAWVTVGSGFLLSALVLFVAAALLPETLAVTLHFFILTIIFLYYLAHNRGLLRFQLLSLASAASCASSLLFEFWFERSVFEMFGFVVTVGLGLVALWLLYRGQRHNASLQQQELIEQEAQAPVAAYAESIPLALSIFLIFSSLYVAALLTVGSYMFWLSSEVLSNIATLVLLSIVYLRPAFMRGRPSLFFNSVCVQLAAFIQIAALEFPKGLWDSRPEKELGEFGIVMDVFTLAIALYVSVKLYRRTPVAWFRFVVSVAIFIFVNILLRDFINEPRHIHYLVLQVALLAYVAYYLWRGQSRSATPFLAALGSWSAYVMYREYGLYARYRAAEQIDVVDVLTTIPRAIFNVKESLLGADADLATSILVYSAHYSQFLVALVPLVLLLHAVKHKGLAMRGWAVVFGLLLAWLCFAKVLLVISFTLLLLAYRYRKGGLFILGLALCALEMMLFFVKYTVLLEDKLKLLAFAAVFAIVFLLVFARSAPARVRAYLRHAKERIKQACTSTHLVRPVRPYSGGRVAAIAALIVTCSFLVIQAQVLQYERLINSDDVVLLRLEPMDESGFGVDDQVMLNYEAKERMIAILEQFSYDQEPSVVASQQLQQKLDKRRLKGMVVGFTVVDGVAEEPVEFYEAGRERIGRWGEYVYLPFSANASWWVSSASERWSLKNTTRFYLDGEDVETIKRARFVKANLARNQLVMAPYLLDYNRRELAGSSIVTPAVIEVPESGRGIFFGLWIRLFDFLIHLGEL